MSNQLTTKTRFSNQNFNEDKEQTTYNNNNNYNNNTSSPKLTNKTLSKNTNSHPRTKELINDKVFQYFFDTYFNSKEYNEFRTLTDLEKLNFMIDLYFFIMVDNNKDSIFDLKETNTEEQLNNINGEIMDRLLMIKDEISRKNIIESMKQYNITGNINEHNMLNNKLKEILNKYKLNNFNNNQNSNDVSQNENEAYITEGSEHNVNTLQKQTHLSMPMLAENTNINKVTNYKNTNVLHSRSTNNTQLKPKNKKKEMSTTSSLHQLNKTESFLRVDYGRVNLIKMGGIKKGSYFQLKDNSKQLNNEYMYTPEKNVFLSKDNDIKDNMITHYICTNTKNKKFKHPNSSEFITPLNYKTLTNPSKRVNVGFFKYFMCGLNKHCFNNNNTKGNFNHKSYYNNSIIIEDIVYDDNVLKQNNRNSIFVVKTKQTDNENTNEIIKKLFEDNESDIITLNKNEINKIGILLIDYIRNEEEKKKILNTDRSISARSRNIGQSGVFNLEMENTLKQIQNRIEESKKFIYEFK
jgi:hypothetical protein